MSLRIEDYAVLGDLQTGALVGRDGSIDWLCLPRFDSPACFSALLDTPEAGRWLLAPADGSLATERAYRDDTLVLQQTWRTPTGDVRVSDFMPPRGTAPDVVRIVEGLSGRVSMRTQLRVRFDYGSVAPWIRRHDGRWSAVAGPDAVWLDTSADVDEDALEAGTCFDVESGQRLSFVLTWAPSFQGPPPRIEADRALTDTLEYWSGWLDGCTYRGPYDEAVRRSLVVLKALTYAPTGGVAAAVTTSLPEQIGGARNWDYRYCWLRDASFMLQVLAGAGFTGEAAAWRSWL
ncbi:MAG: glycoside hydrolase family 15 protein, partial [Nocardioidaceae bacterium]